MGDEGHAFPWMVYGAEMLGTALLIAVGLSAVILDFGRGSPVLAWLPGAAGRRAVTGFLFGTTGALITLSWLGRESGAHINPVVTLGFWLMGRMRGANAVGYVLCQLVGGVLGAVPLLAWGGMGRSIAYGATVPGAAYGAGWALAGETATTFCLVFGLFFCLRHRRLKPFTPALFPPLYAVMVWLEAGVSGTSTNPARTLGPAVIAGLWSGWWVYWLGPVLGALLAVAVHRWGSLRLPRLGVAKLHHFAHDRYGLFHLEAGTAVLRCTGSRWSTGV